MIARSWSWGIILLAASSGVSALCAEEGQTRIFRLHLDAKLAGEVQIEIQENDGGETVSVKSLKQEKLLAGWWHRGYHGIETWKEGRLTRLDAAIDDDGKKRRISATPSDGKLRIIVNDQRHDLSRDAWPTTLWRLPADVQRRQSVELLDVATGRGLRAELAYIGAERLQVAGQDVVCGHYRITSKQLQAELWFDGSDRLVRAELTENLRKTTLELVRVAR